ncbi:MAG: hypothetical protein H7145_12935, partial [Akkermansiaceae bacterium]|nr:hypothetical protein [Armatimonadota bacterium]
MAKRMSGVQALRYLLHQQEFRPIATIATSRMVRDPFTGEFRARVKSISIKPTPINRSKIAITDADIASVHAPLQNAFPAASREMSRRHKEQGRGFAGGNPPVVGIVGRV